MKKKVTIATGLFASILCCRPTAAQKKDATPPYVVNCDDPHSYSCNQYLRLELQQQKVLAAFAAYQASLSALSAEAETIKRENGWPAGVTFRGDTLMFLPPPPADPEKKPPEKKP